MSFTIIYIFWVLYVMSGLSWKKELKKPTLDLYLVLLMVVIGAANIYIDWRSNQDCAKAVCPQGLKPVMQDECLCATKPLSSH